ncbi:MAG: transposase, partial [Thermodesulfovibrionales bacterium]|nr:transposase [Thermodesulfovibrionales bacterium]
MARIARAVAAGFPHHVVQRGNNRENVFIDDEDREKYIELLKKYSKERDARILAYCLMTNHVHLLIKPKENESLYKMMQGVTLCYTQFTNRKYNRTGRLWESRYHSCIVDKDSYLWAVARYIETNPVRARMVKKAEDYAYSSARAHILGKQDDLLNKELIAEAQIKNYREFIRETRAEKDRDLIRYHTRTGKPLGDEAFIKRMERKTGRDLAL